jgi:cell division septal protein FtsQ
MKFALQVKSSKTLLAMVATVVIFGAGSYLLGWSSLLTVKQIEITGAPTSASEKEIRAKLNFSQGDQLARVDARALSNRLQATGWVESADISRNWFNGEVRIDLQPRIPVAKFTSPGKPQAALDASGEVFNLPGELPSGLPNVSATSVASGLIAAELFTQMPKEFSNGIDRLSAESATNLVVYGKFNERTLQIIWGDKEDILLKIKVINSLLELPENKSIRLIDVTAPQAPIVK